MIGGRLRRVKDYLNGETFCFTYGDGVADINIAELLSFHKREGRMATVMAVQPPGRYGALEVETGRVASFQEKPLGDGGWINGGFFVPEPGVFDYIPGDKSTWENEPLIEPARINLEHPLSPSPSPASGGGAGGEGYIETLSGRINRQLAAEEQLSAYTHYGFWHAMDTVRDRAMLEEMWLHNRALWRIWE